MALRALSLSPQTEAHSDPLRMHAFPSNMASDLTCTIVSQHNDTLTQVGVGYFYFSTNRKVRV